MSGVSGPVHECIKPLEQKLEYLKIFQNTAVHRQFLVLSNHFSAEAELRAVLSTWSWRLFSYIHVWGPNQKWPWFKGLDVSAGIVNPSSGISGVFGCM